MCDLSKVTTGLTLKALASIAYAEHLWLKNKSPTDENPCSRDFERLGADDWFELTKKLVKKVLNKNLPQDLTIHIIEVIKSIGNRLRRWVYYATDTLGLDYEGYVVPQSGYPDFLVWTDYGTIDEDSMFEYYYDDEFLYKLHRMCLNEMACSIAHVKYMNDYAHELRSTMKERFKFNLKNDRHFDLIASSLLYVGKAGALTERLKSEYNPRDKSKAVLMFRLCAKDGYYLGVKYYWDKMTSKEQKINLIPAAIDAIQMKPAKRNGKKKGDDVEFDFEKYNFILAFLLVKMKKVERRQFFVEYECGSRMLIILASNWPWQEYFADLFYELQDSLTVKEYLEILTELGRLMIKDAPLAYNIEHSTYYQFFKIVLKNFQVKDYFEEDNKIDLINKFKELLSPLYDLMLIRSLKKILNDVKLKEYRKDFLDCGKKNILGLLEKNDFEKLEKFANKVLQTNDERKNFKMNLNIWEELILNDKYKEVDELLSWQADSIEEREVIKNQIKSATICDKLFKKNDFDAIEKFLNWKCKSTRDKNQITIHYNTKEFLSDKFFEIWTSVDTKKAKSKCYKFLMIIFQTEKNMNKFVKEKIYNDQLLETFCDKISLTKKFGNMELIKELLQFCRINQKEYTDLRLKLTNDINQWIKRYAFEKDCFQVANALVRWVFPNDTKRKEVIKSFLNTNDGLSLAVKMFEKHYGSNDDFVQFTSEWIKPCGSETVKKIKDQVKDSLEEEMSKDHLSCIESALDSLIKGQNISSFNLNYIEESKEERRREKKNRARGFGTFGFDSDSSNECENENEDEDEDSEDDLDDRRQCCIS